MRRSVAKIPIGALFLCFACPVIQADAEGTVVSAQ
jgi:hypothetical protein